MFLLKKEKGTINKEKIVNSIWNWALGHERFLNVVSLPYNSPSIFIKTILEYVSENRKVLYITGEEEENIGLLEFLKKNTGFRDYSYIRRNKVSMEARLKVSNVKIAKDLDECFDLIIYDDLSSISTLSKEEIEAVLKSKAYENTKCIVYSVEPIFSDFREIFYPTNEYNAPIVEPRTVLTRIDLSKDIPFVIYDYIKWYIDGGRKLIIYVPDREKADVVFLYIKKYCHELTVNIYKAQGEEDYRVINNFNKVKKSILVTSELGEGDENYKSTNIMVFFANDYRFDYKKLLHLSRRTGRGERDLKGEVIFLANEENSNMEKAKEIARNFNKEAWEMGLLKI